MERRGNSMAIRANYTVQKIPDTYVTKKTVYEYVPDPDAEQVVGKPTRKIRVEKVVEEKGGWLFTFPRRHSVRCTSLEQIKLLGLSTEPYLIDDTTGLQVNSQGIPLDIAEHVTGGLTDGGVGETVEQLIARGSSKGDPIEQAIDDTE